MMTPLCRAGAVLLIASSLGACAHIKPVQPWEKGVLARPDMQFGSDRLESTLVDHVYSSKEAASGGSGAVGGGCGCY